MGNFKSEFQVKNFGLTHEPIDDFFRSQWQRKRVSVAWLIYRWFLAIFFTGGVIGSLVVYFYCGHWMIYLTNWGFTLCMLTCCMGAILATIYASNPDKIPPGSCVVKFYWLLHWTTLNLAIVITFIYWIFIFPTEDVAATAIFNLWAHAFNSIIMLLDHMVVAFPTRILHVLYPLIFGSVFSLFSLAYYLADGTDIYGNPYIYEILNWEKPGLAVGTVCGCLLLAIVFGLILYGLYCLRKAIYHKRSESMIVLHT